MPYIGQALLSTENSDDFTEGDRGGRRDESKHETAKRGAGELATQGLEVGRPHRGRRSFGVQRTARPTYFYVLARQVPLKGDPVTQESIISDWILSFAIVN